MYAWSLTSYNKDKLRTIWLYLFFVPHSVLDNVVFSIWDEHDKVTATFDGVKKEGGQPGTSLAYPVAKAIYLVKPQSFEMTVKWWHLFYFMWITVSESLNEIQLGIVAADISVCIQSSVSSLERALTKYVLTFVSA